MLQKSDYSSHEKHYVAIDCIIFGFDGEQLKLLLVKRGFEPCKGCWSLMGGFVRTIENLGQAASRVLFELTGLHDIFLEQLHTYGETERDSQARVISVAYYALIKIDDFNETTDNIFDAKWFPIDQRPVLIFDHNMMVDKALRRLRRKAAIQPIGFELLPEKFTLSQLQKLYEAIYGMAIDKRNFRKRVLNMGVLSRLDEIDKLSSRRGAYLYTLDKHKYDCFVDKGQTFLIK